MFSEVLSFLAAMYESLGPAVMFAAALPTMLVVLGVSVGIARKRYGRRQGGA